MWIYWYHFSFATIGYLWHQPGQVLSDGQLLHGLSTDTGHLSLNLIVCLEGLSKDLSDWATCWFCGGHLGIFGLLRVQGFRTSPDWKHNSFKNHCGAASCDWYISLHWNPAWISLWWRNTSVSLTTLFYNELQGFSNFVKGETVLGSVAWAPPARSGCCKSISKTIRNLDLLSQFGSKDEDVTLGVWTGRLERGSKNPLCPSFLNVGNFMIIVFIHDSCTSPQHVNSLFPEVVMPWGP